MSASLTTSFVKQFGLKGKELAAPPRFEHGFEAPQASVISKLHYRAISPEWPPPFKREGGSSGPEARVHWRRLSPSSMAVEIQRAVEFSMIDMANVAYYPRIFDLAHKVFEEAWLPMCGVSYPTLINERRVGFPVVSLTQKTIHPKKQHPCSTIDTLVPT